MGEKVVDPDGLSVAEARAFLGRLEGFPWPEAVVSNHPTSSWSGAYFECIRTALGSRGLRAATRELLDRVNELRCRTDHQELTRGVVVAILARRQKRPDGVGDHESEYRTLTDAFQQAVPQLVP